MSKRTPYFVALLAICLVFAGCSQGTSGSGQVSGNVTDANGNPVRGARVSVGNRESITNSSGVYLLNNLSEGDQLIRANVTDNGLDFFGQNWCRVFKGELTQNINITVVRTNQLAAITGTVVDRAGFLIQNCRLYARGAGLGSSTTITDSQGRYTLGGLVAGISYQVFATGQGYNSDNVTVTLAAGETRPVNFILNDPTTPNMPVPSGVGVVSWTSPKASSNSPEAGEAVAAIKNLLMPRLASASRAKVAQRTTSLGNFIEADLFWNTVSNPSLIGFGVYRARSQNGAFDYSIFVADALATFFANSDPDLRVGVPYWYAVSSVGSTTVGGQQNQSALSPRISTTPIGDLLLQSVTYSPLTFRWNAAQGASTYNVFVFDRYPNLSAAPIWPTSMPYPFTSGTSMVYGGPALQNGFRYYYVVTGTSASGDAVTISPVQEFVY